MRKINPNTVNQLLLFDVEPIEQKPKKTKDKIKVIKNEKLRNNIIKKIELEFRIKINPEKYNFYELWQFYEKHRLQRICV